MKILAIYLSTLSFLITFSCNINDTANAYGEILFNSSFEKNGHPYNDGWDIKDESNESYSTDVPPYGGNYSLCLKGDTLNLLGQSAEFILPALIGNNIYEFSFWGKQQGACGVVHIFVKTSDTSGYYTKSELVCDPLWSYYNIIDTIQTDIGDSLSIILGGYSGEGKVYFDLCKLKKIN